jgi:tRNA (adenine57-N1/adenine58-N1)-methyltransferase
MDCLLSIQQTRPALHPNCIFSSERKVAAEGDFVIFWDAPDQQNQAVLAKGAVHQSKDGRFAHDEVIGSCEFGSKVYTRNGYTTLVKPNSHMYTCSLKQRTQILYTPDIALVTHRLHLQPGSVVVESGTGTGSLSVSILRSVFPQGHLFTFEFNQVRQQKAAEDFSKIGLAAHVTSVHRDVLTHGFLVEGALEEAGADAIFLDLPKPEQAVKHALKVLKPKGRLCNFSPCIEQVQKVCLELARQGFYEIRTFECLSKEVQTSAFPYQSIYSAQQEEPSAKKSRRKEEKNKRKAKHLDKAVCPASQQQAMMRGHTGYLTFAIKF